MSQKKWKVWLQRFREKSPSAFEFLSGQRPQKFFLVRFWSKFKIVQKCLFLEIFTKEFFGEFLIFKFSNCKNKQKLSKPEFHCSEKLWAQKKERDGKRERERKRKQRERERERDWACLCRLISGKLAFPLLLKKIFLWVFVSTKSGTVHFFWTLRSGKLGRALVAQGDPLLSSVCALIWLLLGPNGPVEYFLCYRRMSTGSSKKVV